jgi:hypothetical protein
VIWSRAETTSLTADASVGSGAGVGAKVSSAVGEVSGDVVTDDATGVGVAGAASPQAVAIPERDSANHKITNTLVTVVLLRLSKDVFPPPGSF